MSYYSIHPVYVDYMICTTCSTEAFSWLAESFSCPNCGNDDYASPHDTTTELELSRLCSEKEIPEELRELHQEELQRHLALVLDNETQRRGEISQAMCGRKRKRSLSDVGGR